MFKRIVKFNDGTYGVRKWTLFNGYLMLDIEDAIYWWHGVDYQKEYCRGTLEQAKTALENWNNRKGKPIKVFSKSKTDCIRTLNTLHSLFIISNNK